MVVLAFLGAGGYFIWSFWRRNLPDLGRLLLFSIFFVPFALLGARLWNYLNWEHLRQIVDQGSLANRFQNFFGFGETGLSGLSFFGGFFAIIIYFFLVFSWYSRKYRISRWLGFDILLQGVLIFQIIGRWGNFFNQELLGQVLTRNYPQEFGWIPEWLGNKLHFKDEYSWVVRHPLFLYESLANLLLLFCLLFWKRIGLFTLFFRSHHNPILQKQIVTDRQNWSKQKWTNFWGYSWWRKWIIVSRFYSVTVSNPPVNFNETPPVTLHHQIGFWKFNSQSALYQRELLYINQNLSFWSRMQAKFWLFWRRNSRDLTAYFNPYQLLIPRVGLTTSFYLLGYGIIRAVLQTFREGVPDSEPIATPYYVAGLFIFFGLISFYGSQFLWPAKWRSPNWYYETWYWKH